MNIEATKIDLVQRLLTIEDEEILQRIEAVLDLDMVVNPDLTDAIQAGLEDIKAGRVHPHSEVRKLYSKWIKE